MRPVAATDAGTRAVSGFTHFADAGTLGRMEVGKTASGHHDRFKFHLLWLGLLLVIGGGCTNFHGRGLRGPVPHRYGVADAQFARSTSALLGAPLVEGNRVTVLLNGDQMFPDMLAAIRAAKHSINLETYIYWSGEVGQAFAEALAERARAGVAVRVLIDWIGGRKLSERQMRLMRRAGVDVRKYNPVVLYNLARLNHRDHRKLLIIDGRIGYIGGAGIADLWLGNAQSPKHWRDTQYRVEGPVVAQMQAAFLDNWMKTTGQVLDGPAYFPELAPVGPHRAQAFFSSPREGAEPVRLMYLLALAAAQKSIRLSASYFVPDKLIAGELLRAARRGVDIEIIVPGGRHDTPLARLASRAQWGDLLRAGVRLYEYQPTMYHCKGLIVDELWVSIGSANFDRRSFNLSDEANLNVYSAEFAAEQLAVFEADKRQCRQLTYEQWRRRSLGKRLLEQLARPFRAHL
jgi:cardiolipin synthase